MKKFVSVILVVMMVFSALPVLAEGNIAEEVLLKVKSKIDVPKGLTEFYYGESTYDNVIRYDFTWHDEDYNREIYVTSDALGRIVSYNRYENTDYSADRCLIGYTLADAQPLAENFVKKAYGEYFEDRTDTLRLDTDYTGSSYSGRYKSFSFRFERFRNDEIVESNYVTVRVRATKDKIYVQSASAALDETAVFTEEKANEKGKSDYTYHFPVRLYYATDYSDKEAKATLFYSIDKGYVSRVDGEILSQIYFDRYADFGVMEDAMESETTANGSMSKKELTEEEIKALEEMEGLVKPQEVEKVLRGFDILHITDDMKIEESSARKYDDGYVVNFTLQGDKQSTYITYDGETGEVTYISSYISKSMEERYSTYYNEDGSVKEKEEKVIDYKANEDKVKAFAEEMAKDKIGETDSRFIYNGHDLTYSAERLVNGVVYPENRVRVIYDAQEEFVTNYNVYWDEDVSMFPKPDEAISHDAAEGIIFEIAPIYNTFVKTKEGYMPAITIPEDVTINAITGIKQYASTTKKMVYTDIDSHWAKDMINVLWEHDIYLAGDKFKPDDAITQADMIRLFSACRDSGVIPIGWEKSYIAEYGFNNGYVETNEPDKLMTRKEAFESLVEILGYGEIAGFDIYKSSFADLEANGSAEILKAMGILVGDTARGDDYLTNAEAAVMVYRYLSK